MLTEQVAPRPAGDVLYEIESSRYEAALAQAQAELAQARARLQSDEPLAKRYTELAAIDAISKQERDNAQATLAQDKADIATAQAAVRTARINLDFTEIRAPGGYLRSLSAKADAGAFSCGPMIMALMRKAA